MIRKSSDREAKVALSLNTLSDKQADAVLELGLYQLTGLEREKLKVEYKELLAKIEEYRAILASELKVRGIIKDEPDSLKSLRRKERKSMITLAKKKP